MGYKGISGLHSSQGSRAIGVMQAIMVSLNYTLASLVSTAVGLQFLYGSLQLAFLLGLGISGSLARTVSKLISFIISQAVMEVNFSI